MNSLTNNSLRLMERSMEFLWTKQAAILDNISNAETPNYKAKVVTFEESMQRQLEAVRRRERPGAAAREVLEEAVWKVEESEESVRMDGNGVNITEQNVELARTAYQLQYAMQAISSDLSVLRTAIKG